MMGVYSIRSEGRATTCSSIHAVIEAAPLNDNWTETQVTYVYPQRKPVLG